MAPPFPQTASSRASMRAAKCAVMGWNVISAFCLHRFGAEEAVARRIGGNRTGSRQKQTTNAAARKALAPGSKAYWLAEQVTAVNCPDD